MADGLEHPPDDVLAALVEHHLDQRLARLGVDDPEAVDRDQAVLQLDARPQPLADVARRPARGSRPGRSSARRTTGAAAGARARRRWSAAAGPRCRCPAGRRGTAARCAGRRSRPSDGRPFGVVHRGDHAGRLVDRQVDQSSSSCTRSPSTWMTALRGVDPDARARARPGRRPRPGPARSAPRRRGGCRARPGPAPSAAGRRPGRARP